MGINRQLSCHDHRRYAISDAPSKMGFEMVVIEPITDHKQSGCTVYGSVRKLSMHIERLIITCTVFIPSWCDDKRVLMAEVERRSNRLAATYGPVEATVRLI